MTQAPGLLLRELADWESPGHAIDDLQVRIRAVRLLTIRPHPAPLTLLTISGDVVEGLVADNDLGL